MSEVTICEVMDGSWRIDYINGEWATAYGLTREQAEYYKENFNYDEINNKFGWY